MRFRLAGIPQTSPAAASFERGFQAIFNAPLMQAQAAEEARDAEMRRGVMQAQQRSANASATLHEQQAAAAQDRQQRTTLPKLVETAAMIHGVPVHEVPEVQQWAQTGQLGPKYQTPVDGVGPVLPAPAYADTAPGGLGHKLFRTLGLLQGQLTNGDSNIENLAKAGGAFQQQDAIDAMAKDPAMVAIYGPAYAAAGGKPQFQALGTTGRALNQFTGQEQVVSPTLVTQQDESHRAGIDVKRAQAQRTGGGAGGFGKAPAGYRFTMTEDGEAVLEPIPGGPKDPGAVPPKPMPSTAVRMQQEELDAIGSASAIDADLGALQKQITDGKLMLGVVTNLWNKARNGIGLSNEESRNLASFQATLERMRNDSLRLNKGVQTEGDAVRAWNELVASINDPKVVEQRLTEIRRINKRAAELRRLNIEVMRSNFGQPPLDTSGHTNLPAAVGGGAAAPAAAQAPATRSSVSNW